MSMRNEPPLDFARENRDPIDALIDSAARQLVAGEPSLSMRRAVRERIEHRRSPWLLAPAIAGAAAVIAIAIVLVGRTVSGPAGTPDERDNVRPTIERAATPAPPPQVVEPEGIRSVLPWPAEAQERRRQADQRGPTRRLADDVAALPQEEEPLIPPLAIEPLETDQIAVGKPITVESSGVMPIEIDPLQIEPLRSIE